MASLQGFGGNCRSDGFLFHPTSTADLHEVADLAVQSGRKIALRGSARSYGDPAQAAEAFVLDLSQWNQILDWNPETGVLIAEPGVTLEQIWRLTLPDGYWLPVVSGTMRPTLAGALAMNIHGKNAADAGTLGEWVDRIDVWSPRGTHILLPDDPDFTNVISGAGLLGVITQVTLRMKRVPSGEVDVKSLHAADWDGQFAAFAEEESADYRVSWVDAFGQGRGHFHSARYAEDGRKDRAQDLPSRILGLWPKAWVWPILRLLNTRSGMRTLNSVKALGAKFAHNKVHRQGLVEFQFLLDYVPNWQRAYGADGLLQFQPFVPKEHAREVFQALLADAADARMEPFLAVMKRHRADKLNWLFGYALDGYSLALDFKVQPASGDQQKDLLRRMTERVLDAGGRFYFAKDSVLSPSEVQRYLGEATLARYHEAKTRLDPNGLFTSDLARRLGLEIRTP